MSLFNSLPLVAVVSGFGNVKLGFPLEENTLPPHFFSTKISTKMGYPKWLTAGCVFWAADSMERTVLQVPCRCRPSSLAHLDEFHTSFKLHGLEMRTTGSFSGKGGWNPVIYEQNLSFVIQMETHYLLYFSEMPNQKEKVNIKRDDHLIGKWPCAHIQILDLYISKNCRNTSSTFGEGCSLGPWLRRWRCPHWGLDGYFHHKISIGRVFPFGFFSLWFLSVLWNAERNFWFVLLMEEIRRSPPEMYKIL